MIPLLPIRSMLPLHTAPSIASLVAAIPRIAIWILAPHGIRVDGAMAPLVVIGPTVVLIVEI
jgi:hypothetical protein